MEKELMVVSLKEIRPSELNHRKRFDEAKMKDLVASIKEQGVIVPVMVRKVDGKSPYELVCGERRYRASQEAGLKEILAVVWTDMTDQKALEFQVLENLQREDVHPLEEAEGYESLIKNHGFKSVDEIAAKIGKSRGYVYGRMKLCDLTKENRKRFYDGKFNASIALLVARIPEHLQNDAGVKISGQDAGCSGEPMSHRRAQQFITEEFMLRLKDAPFDTDDAMLSTMAGSCTMCPKKTGNQQELFPDISSADVCTDPACFKEKKEVGLQRAMAKAKEAGKTLISEREARKIFPEGAIGGPRGGYVGLDETCEEDRLKRTYKQLAKVVKDAKIAVAVDPNKEELVAMVTKAEAARIRKQAGIKKAEKTAKAAKTSKGERAKELERALDQERSVQERNRKAIGVIIDEARRDKKQSFLRPMVDGMLENYLTPQAALAFMQRRNSDIKKHEEAINEVHGHVREIDDAELIIFVLEMLMTEQTCDYSGGKTIKALCKHYGIDLSKLKADVKKQEQPADATKTPDDEAKKGSADTKPGSDETSKAPEAAEKPYQRDIMDGKEGAKEYKTKSGAKVVMKAKGVAMTQEAADAVADVADAFGMGEEPKADKPSGKKGK